MNLIMRTLIYKKIQSYKTATLIEINDKISLIQRKSLNY